MNNKKKFSCRSFLLQIHARKHDMHYIPDCNYKKKPTEQNQLETISTFTNVLRISFPYVANNKCKNMLAHYLIKRTSTYNILNNKKECAACIVLS